MRLDKYVDRAGYIDIRKIALGRNELLAEAKRREGSSEQESARELTRNFALCILSLLAVAAILLYFGMP